MNVHEPPKFSQNSIEIPVQENARVGATVTTIAAIYADPKAFLNYSFQSGNKDNAFCINRDGVITVARPLDLVKLTDINDNSPEFEKELYQFSVKENAGVSTSVGKVVANDLDAGSFGKINYKLLQTVDEQSQKLFKVDEGSGVITTLDKLDYEDIRQHFLFIKAEDNSATKLSAITEVRIDVQDVNDNSPTFSATSYRAKVSLDATVGEHVVQVTATDLDSTSNGLVIYSIVRGNDEQAFKFDDNKVSLEGEKNMDASAILNRWIVLLYITHKLTKGDSEKTGKYAEAVVEKDGKIAFVGALGEAKRIYPKAQNIDLGGRCMMPGHIDPHLHPSMANSQVDWEAGHFFEMGLDALMATTSFRDQVFPLIEKGYPELVKVVNRNGITAVGDLEFPLFEEALEKDLAEKNLKSKDAYFSTYCVASSRNYERMAGGDREKAMKLILEASDNISNDQVMLYKDHIKLLLDGAFYSQLMQMKDGYLDKHEGQWITPPEEFEEAMEIYWKNGYQIHIHTNGDLGMEELLDTVEGLLKWFPRENHKTTVEHAGYFTEDQAERIAKMGLMVSAAPYYFYTLADKYSEKGLGPDSAHAIAPMKWLFERGVVTAFHSDFTMAPAQPLLFAWCAINRITAEGMHHRDDLCCSVYEGMLAITKNAAIILGTDDIIGTIEEGKLANFTILDKDPLKLHPTAIRDIKVHASVYKGRKNIVNL
ncbi:hypothetical protein QZH41_005671 [Actinostola sp. cb2023]|nr:hypothetical protein QZH41_005671 [Actinostola sp. cb2023]